MYLPTLKLPLTTSTSVLRDGTFSLEKIYKTKPPARVLVTFAARRKMSKLSPSLKGLINAPFARPGQTPAPRNIEAVYTKIADEARERKYGEKPWLALSVCFFLSFPIYLLPGMNMIY